MTQKEKIEYIHNINSLLLETLKTRKPINSYEKLVFDYHILQLKLLIRTRLAIGGWGLFTNIKEN